jgi:hypothetical protein
MDLVLTFVNGLDPVWQQEYESSTKMPLLTKRFRDWGTLRYLLRAVAKNMPFIGKVHLVVSGESQVPEWVNRDEVHVVLHRDIIPKEYLPTFNSNTIELHLPFIEGLDEEFIYSNDDIFPMLECRAEDFFSEGRGIIGMSRHLLYPDMFKKICRNSDRAARRALGLKPRCYFLRPQHICAPMRRSRCDEVYNRLRDELLTTLTRTRTERNITQYLFTDYLYLAGGVINRRQSSRHFSMAVASPDKIEKYLRNPDRRLVCINDVELSDKRYEEMQQMLDRVFVELFPEKSKYEL